MNIKQLYTTQAYVVKEDGIYKPEDLIEAGFVMEADGKGKIIRNLFETGDPAVIRTMIELYIVDRDYYTDAEAKEEYKNNRAKIEFKIPDIVPPLGGATKRLVERAMAESK